MQELDGCNIRSDSSIFVYHRNGHHLIILLYVDDIILTFCSFRIYSKVKKTGL